MTTQVVHCKRADFDVYIGRPGPWGNPFKVEHPDQRRFAIAQYRRWVEHSPEPEAAWVREHVGELKGKRLGCWCAPQACHGDVLAAMADA